MFRCAFGEGHVTLPGQRRIMVATVIRKVSDQHHHGWDPNRGEARFTKFGEGVEIKQELPFCEKHAAMVVPVELKKDVTDHHHFHTGAVAFRR